MIVTFSWIPRTSLAAVSLALAIASPAAPAAAAPAASTAAAPRTIAISYFDNNTGKADLDPLAKGLADMLITDMAQVQTIRIVEREKLNAVIAELKLSRTRFIDPKTAQRLGRGLAARYVMTGGYALVGDTLRIDARVFEVESGAVVTGESVQGKRDEFFALEKDLVDVLVRALSIKVAPSERTKLRMNATQSFTAWQNYSAGLDASDKGDGARARALFEKALAADPGYRAARTAADRLAAILSRHDQQTTADADSDLARLDPKAPDLGARVETMLQSLSDTKTDQLRRKLALLAWLGERNVLACVQTSGAALGDVTVINNGVPMGGVISHCRHAHEVLLMAYRLRGDPDEWDALPKVCEHFIRQLPADRAVFAYCGMMLEDVNHKRADGAAAARQELAEDQDSVRKMPGDGWQQSLLHNNAALKKLVRLYARPERP